jgi:diamine N-acetyltransferase
MIEIVQVRPHGVDIVKDLAERIWPHTFSSILKPTQIRYMLDWMYDEGTLREQVQTGHLFYVLKNQGQHVGFVGLEPNCPDADFLRIHKLYMLPEYQGKGLGRELLNHSIDVAFDLGLKRLHLNVNRYNPAVEFYKHVGFSIIGEENIDIGKGFLMEDYIMELILLKD